VAGVLEALLGAIFLDSDYSLKIVWDVHLLLQKSIGKSL